MRSNPSKAWASRGAWTRALILAAIAVTAYARCSRFEYSFVDDTKLILDDQTFLLNADSLVLAFRRPYLDSYYRPLLTDSYVLDAQWSGPNPFGYHVTNIALHGVATSLLSLLLDGLQFTPWPACLAVALFALHPALVSSVAWIPGRNDSLLAIWTLGACLLLTAYVERRDPRYYIAHIGCFAAALFTKETAIILPAVFAWQLRCTRGERREETPVARPWPAWIVVVVVYIALRAAAIRSRPGAGADHLQMLLRQLPVLGQNLGKLFVPTYLSPLAIARDVPAWPGIVVVVVGGAALAAARFRRPKMVWFGLGTLLLPMLPNLAVAERWTLENRLYLPAVGLCVIAAEVLESGARKGQWRMAVAYGMLGMCALMTFRYQESFRNRETFTRAAVLGSPNSAMAHLVRGGAYQEVGHDLDAAEREYRRAIQLDPDEPIAHNDLGVLLMSRKRWNEAEAELREEIARNPDYGVAYYNVGIVLRELGRPDEAAREWQRALERDPKHINSMGELLVYYGKRGDRQMAAHYITLLAGQGVHVSISPSGDVSAAQ